MELTREQLRLYSQRVAVMLAWVVRARQRLDRLGVAGSVYDLTLQAEHALLALRIDAHYRSCPDACGMGSCERMQPKPAGETAPADGEQLPGVRPAEALE